MRSADAYIEGAKFMYHLIKSENDRGKKETEIRET